MGFLEEWVEINDDWGFGFRKDLSVAPMELLQQGAPSGVREL